MITKICTTCKKEQLIKNFHKHKKSKDGYSCTCKLCKKEIDNKYRLDNKEILKLKNKIKYENNKEKIKQKRKIYREKNLEKIREKNKIYEANHKGKAKERSQKWYEKNSKKAIDRMTRWKNDNKERYNKWSKENISKRRKEDLEFKLKQSMRALLRRCKLNKKDRTSKLLGYTFKKLKQRIECQFKNEMSWENYGKWHIDHKKPLSKFDLKITPPHIVNALCNLQPLWASDNLSKGNRYIG